VDGKTLDRNQKSRLAGALQGLILPRVGFIPLSNVDFGSILVIENSEPNFRKGSEVE
jgi:hypothetical protein